MCVFDVLVLILLCYYALIVAVWLLVGCVDFGWCLVVFASCRVLVLCLVLVLFVFELLRGCADSWIGFVVVLVFLLWDVSSFRLVLLMVDCVIGCGGCFVLCCLCIGCGVARGLM